MMHDEHELARRVAERLGEADGVEAVTLGGAWAYPDPPPDANPELYLYVQSGAAPSLAALRSLVGDLNAELPTGPPEPFEASPPRSTWMWAEGHRFALHVRDLRAVDRAVEHGLAGVLGGPYTPGTSHSTFHPTLMGEVRDGRPVYDPRGVLEELRETVHPYPYELRRSLLLTFGEDVDRMMYTAQQALDAGDAYLAAQLVGRGVSYVAQILFAANGRYLAFERTVLQRLATLPDRPRDAPEVLALALGAGAEPATLRERVTELRALVGEVQLRYVQPLRAGV